MRLVEEGEREEVSYNPVDYRRVVTREDARGSRQQAICIVSKISVEDRYAGVVTDEARRAYKLLKELEGSFCLLDGNIPAVLHNVQEPPRWSTFIYPDSWEHSYIGSWWSIYLFKNTR